MIFFIAGSTSNLRIRRFFPALQPFSEKKNDDEQTRCRIGLPETKGIIEAESKEECDGEKSAGKGLFGIGDQSLALDLPAGLHLLIAEQRHDNYRDYGDDNSRQRGLGDIFDDELSQGLIEDIKA